MIGLENKTKIRILTISDTHNYHADIKELPKADIIACIGDYTSTGTIAEVNSFFHWYSKLDQYPIKLLCNGNHEKGFQANSSLYKQLIPDNITYLEHETIELLGLKIFMSPYSPEFFFWSYMYSRGEKAKNLWKSIPDNTDIVMTHSPAYGFGDLVEYYNEGEDPHVGCKDLLNRLLEIKPLLAVSGHIHGGRSAIQGEHTLFINTSICSEAYEPVNKPFVVDIDLETKKVEIIQQ